MKDPRIVRQTMQAIAALLLAASPAIIAQPFDWRVLVAAEIAASVALLTNPRLVAGLESAMPSAGSSAVLPTDTTIKPKGPAQ